MLRTKVCYLKDDFLKFNKEKTITVSNDDAGTADTINLDGAVDITFNANDTLELVYVNGSWYQVSSSDN